MNNNHRRLMIAIYNHKSAIRGLKNRIERKKLELKLLNNSDKKVVYLESYIILSNLKIKDKLKQIKILEKKFNEEKKNYGKRKKYSIYESSFSEKLLEV